MLYNKIYRNFVVMADKITYTTKGIIDFGTKFKGTPIIDLFDTVAGRNYLVWMKLNKFQMSAQLFEKVERQHKFNLTKGSGHDYEADPKNYKDDISNYRQSDRDDWYSENGFDRNF